jgi:hypothetical protein
VHDAGPIPADLGEAHGTFRIVQACTDCDLDGCGDASCLHGACGATAVMPASQAGHCPLQDRNRVVAKARQMSSTERISSPFRPPRS